MPSTAVAPCTIEETVAVDTEPLIELLGHAQRLYYDDADGTSTFNEILEDVLTSAGAGDPDHPLRVAVESRRVALQLESARDAAGSIEQLEVEARLLDTMGTTEIYESPEWLAYCERSGLIA